LGPKRVQTNNGPERVWRKIFASRPKDNEGWARKQRAAGKLQSAATQELCWVGANLLLEKLGFERRCDARAGGGSVNTKER